MSQKAIKGIAFIITYSIPLLLLEGSPAFAGGMNKPFVRGSIVLQETYKANGIFVSRPAPLDKRILDLLSINCIRSVEDYVQWLQKNITYKKDSDGDVWSAPEETLQRRWGDCEDIAYLNEAFLRMLGYKPRVLAMGSSGRNHAICVFRESGYYLWIDNSRLKRTRTKSILEFARHVFAEYGCSYLLELHFRNKSWDILLKKQDTIVRCNK